MTDVTPELSHFTKQMTPKNIRNVLRRSYRAVSKRVREIAIASARQKVRASNPADFERGIRAHIYSKGGGFMITVKSRKAGKNGRGEKSMYAGRNYKKTKRRVPVQMWLEDGTEERSTRGKKRILRKRTKGKNRGKVKARGFLAEATPKMYQTATQDLYGEVENAVLKIANKNGIK